MMHASFQKILHKAAEAYSDEEPYDEDASELENGVENITISRDDTEGDTALNVRFDSVLLQQVKANKVKYNKELKSKQQRFPAESDTANPWVSQKPKRTKKVIVIDRVDAESKCSPSSIVTERSGASGGASDQFCFPQYDWSEALNEMMNNRKRGRSDSLEDDPDTYTLVSGATRNPENDTAATGGNSAPTGTVLPIIGSLGSATANDHGNSSRFEGCFDNNEVSLRDFIKRSTGNKGGSTGSGAGFESNGLLAELNHLIVEELRRGRENTSNLTHEEAEKALERRVGSLLPPGAEDATSSASPAVAKDRPPALRTREEKLEKSQYEFMAKIYRLRTMDNSRIDLDAARSMEEDFKNQYGSKKFAETTVAYGNYALAKDQARAEKKKQAEKQREKESLAQAEKEKEKEAEGEGKQGMDGGEPTEREVTPDQMRLLKLRGILNSALVPQSRKPIWRCLRNASGTRARAKLDNLTPLHMLIARAHKYVHPCLRFVDCFDVFAHVCLRY